MKVTRDTTYDEFLAFEPLMAAGELDRLEAAAVADVFGVDGLMSMTVGDLLDAMHGDLSALMPGGGKTVFDVYRGRAFRRFVESLVATLKEATLPAAPSDIAARRGTLEMGFDESVYTFCRAYFGLPSFACVDDLTVADYVLAKRDDFNRATVDRNVAAAMKGGRP